MSRHAAIVLAAGGSARLGRPKQLLTRDGETLVRRAVRLAAETEPARLVVVVGAHRESVEAALAGTSFETVVNPDWRDGLGTSLRAAALALSRHEGPTLVLGCDQPALEVAHLARLLALASSAASRCAATWHGTSPGIPAVVDGSLLASAESFAGDRGFGPALAALAPGACGRLDAPELDQDVDTEADLAAAVARGTLDSATPARGCS